MAMIRSTYNGRLASLALHNSRLQEQMGRAQLEAASGLKVMKPSDAAGQVTLLHGIREQRANQEVFEDSAQWAYSLHLTADDALTEISHVLSDARELTVQMASEVLSDAQRVNAGGSAQGLFDRMLQQLNSNLDGRHIFGGTSYDAEAYDSVTGAYLGDTDQPETQITEAKAVATGWDGSDLLQGTGDVVAAMDNLRIALATGNAANVRAVLDDLDSAIDQVAEARTVIGSDMQRAEDAMALSESMNLALARHESDIVDADAITSYTALFEIQTAYEAALQVTAGARTNLLFNRL